jgi:hypothetical protein
MTMWIFSKTGMFSVVVDQQRPGMMLVRARCGVDIANLYGQFEGELPSMTEPVSSELRDYRWRCSISKDDFVKLAGKLAEQVDYGNFKAAVAKEPSQQNKSEAYHRVWAELLAVQRDEQNGEQHGESHDVAFANFDAAADAADSAWESFIAKTESQRIVNLSSDEKSKPPSASNPPKEQSTQAGEEAVLKPPK